MTFCNPIPNNLQGLFEIPYLLKRNIQSLAESDFGVEQAQLRARIICSSLPKFVLCSLILDAVGYILGILDIIFDLLCLSDPAINIRSAFLTDFSYVFLSLKVISGIEHCRASD